MAENVHCSSRKCVVIILISIYCLTLRSFLIVDAK